MVRQLKNFLIKENNLNFDYILTCFYNVYKYKV